MRPLVRKQREIHRCALCSDITSRRWYMVTQNSRQIIEKQPSFHARLQETRKMWHMQSWIFENQAQVLIWCFWFSKGPRVTFLALSCFRRPPQHYSVQSLTNIEVRRQLHNSRECMTMQRHLTVQNFWVKLPWEECQVPQITESTKGLCLLPRGESKFVG